MKLKSYCVPGTHGPALDPRLWVSLSSRDTIVIQISKATPRLQLSYGESKGKRPQRTAEAPRSSHKMTIEERLKNKKHTLPYREQGRRWAATLGFQKAWTGLERDLLWLRIAESLVFCFLLLLEQI